jgi:hypothetical protein
MMASNRAPAPPRADLGAAIQREEGGERHGGIVSIPTRVAHTGERVGQPGEDASPELVHGLICVVLAMLPRCQI